jgi:hypothetical protein
MTGIWLLVGPGSSIIASMSKLTLRSSQLHIHQLPESVSRGIKRLQGRTDYSKLKMRRFILPLIIFAFVVRTLHAGTIIPHRTPNGLKICIYWRWTDRGGIYSNLHKKYGGKSSRYRIGWKVGVSCRRSHLNVIFLTVLELRFCSLY